EASNSAGRSNGEPVSPEIANIGSAEPRTGPGGGDQSRSSGGKNATQTIPIVMLTIDPVGLGLVGSLSRPGGNVTGLSYYSEAISGKRLELLKEVVPGLARVGVLRNPVNPMHRTSWKETEVPAQRLGVALEALEVQGPEDFEAAFATAKQ